MDNKSKIIVGVDVGAPDKRSNCEKALEQLRRMKWRHRITPETVGADKGCAAREFIHEVLAEGIDPHIPIVDHRRHNGTGIYTIKDFTYNGAKDVFICPEGKELKYWDFTGTADNRSIRRAQRIVRCAGRKKRAPETGHAH